MREFKPGDPQLHATDGMPLLFTEQVAEMAGTKADTIRGYHSKAKAARRARKPARFPAPDEYVRRTILKSDGRPLTVRTPVWRRDRMEAWNESERLGPGGRVRTRAAANG